MPLNTLGGNEELNEKQNSLEVEGESYDSEKSAEELAKLRQESSDAKKGQLDEADSLKQNLLMQFMVEEEKTRLDQFNEAILDIDISNNKENGGYKNIREILNKDIDTKEKLKLMVKIIHSMNDKIDITYRYNKQEHEDFYCGNRALFFNYLFNNYKDKLNNIVESNICLPYGHVMNLIKFEGGETYIVDGGAGCFNKIEYDKDDIEEKGSWKCIKLKNSIDKYEGVKKAYPYTNFPYTEQLNKEQLEIYTSFNLQAYSYFFTDRLYTVARLQNPNIVNKEGLQDFLENNLKGQENPLQGILSEGDSLAKGTHEQQIETLQSHIDSALPYEENLQKFNSIKKYMNIIANGHPDLPPESRGKTLNEFHADDIKTMDALNIPKKKISEIIKKLQEQRGTTDMISYILDKFNNNEDIIKGENNDDLNETLERFLEALNIKATQGNSSLEDYLQEYLSDYESSNKNEEMV